MRGGKNIAGHLSRAWRGTDIRSISDEKLSIIYDFLREKEYQHTSNTLTHQPTSTFLPLIGKHKYTPNITMQNKPSTSINENARIKSRPKADSAPAKPPLFKSALFVILSMSGEQSPLTETKNKRTIL